MDTCLRFVLWTVLLFGCLQAKPVRNVIFKHLVNEVTCDPKMNFTSPTITEVKGHCHNAALKIIKDGLKHSKNTCQGTLLRIDQALKKLEALPQIPESPSTNSTDCTWEDEGSQKPFKNFVEDIKVLVEKLNSQSATSHPAH